MNLNNFFSFFFRSVLIKSGCYFIQLLDGNQIPFFEKKNSGIFILFPKKNFPCCVERKKIILQAILLRGRNSLCGFARGVKTLIDGRLFDGNFCREKFLQNLIFEFSERYLVDEKAFITLMPTPESSIVSINIRTRDETVVKPSR